MSKIFDFVTPSFRQCLPGQWPLFPRHWYMPMGQVRVKHNWNRGGGNGSGAYIILCEGMLIRVRGKMNKFVNTAKNASRRPRTQGESCQCSCGTVHLHSHLHGMVHC